MDSFAKVFNLGNVGSTNDYAMQLLDTYNNALPDNQFLLITAKNQTAGKGKGARKWISKPGNLFMTMAIKNPLIPSQSLMAILAMSIIISIESYVEKKIQFKWPNDILINSNKVCGILPEQIFKNNCTKLVIGAGINIIPAAHYQGINAQIKKKSMLNKITNLFFEIKNKYQNYGINFIINFLNDRLYMKNETAEINNAIGTVIAINKNLSLSLRINGHEQQIIFGELICKK